jgi:hypothetical protein
MISCSQSAYGVKDIYLFKTMRMSGTVARDENGKILPPRVDTAHFMYVEVKGDGVSWLGAWKQGRSYRINAFPENNLPIELGKNKMTGENVLLHASKGYKFWLLSLLPDSVNRPLPASMKENEIILQGKSGNKIFILRSNKEIELVQPDAQ